MNEIQETFIVHKRQYMLQGVHCKVVDPATDQALDQSQTLRHLIGHTMHCVDVGYRGFNSAGSSFGQSMSVQKHCRTTELSQMGSGVPIVYSEAGGFRPLTCLAAARCNRGMRNACAAGNEGGALIWPR